MATILSIQETQEIRDCVRIALQRNGHRVLSVPNLEEGKKLLDINYHHLIVLDDDLLFGSPDKDIALVREFSAGIPMIITAQPDTVADWLEYGKTTTVNVVALLQKPFLLTTLQAMVAHGLNDHQFRNFYTVVERKDGSDWDENEARELGTKIVAANPAVEIYRDTTNPEMVVVFPLIHIAKIKPCCPSGVTVRYASDRTCCCAARL